jgi:uncharacterized protein YbaR (Trm112 family)
MLCHKCKTDQPEAEFSPVARKYAARERNLWCRSCRNAYSREARKRAKVSNPERIAREKRRARVRSYGISPEQYDELKMRQGGRCAICGAQPQRELDIDHCHLTGRVRGLLCNRCNKALGIMDDSAMLLSSAVQYLTNEGVK